MVAYGPYSYFTNDIRSHQLNNFHRRQEALCKTLQQYLEASKGNCAFCLIEDLGDARHSINECLHDGSQAVGINVTFYERNCQNRITQDVGFATCR